METELEVVEGMQFDRGYLSQYMVTDSEKWWLTLKIRTVWLQTRKFPISKKSWHLGKHSPSNRPLLIIADDVDGRYATLVLEQDSGTFNVVAAKAPGFVTVAMLEDIAILTGGTVNRRPSELKDATIEALGQEEDQDKDSTAIVDAGIPTRFLTVLRLSSQIETNLNHREKL